MSVANSELSAPTRTMPSPVRVGELGAKVIEKTSEAATSTFDAVRNPNYTFLMLYLDGVNAGLESAFDAMPAGKGAKLKEIATYAVLAYIGSKGNPAMKQKFPIDVSGLKKLPGNINSLNRDHPSAVSKSLAELTQAV